MHSEGKQESRGTDVGRWGNGPRHNTALLEKRKRRLQIRTEKQEEELTVIIREKIKTKQ